MGHRIRLMDNVMTMSGHKYCRTCECWKALDEFHKDRSTKDGRQGQCKACRRARRLTQRAKPEVLEAIKQRNRDWWLRKNQADPEYRRATMLAWRYGISPEDYDRMLEAQHGRCLFCNLEHSADKPLVVDHNHSTGEVRGLLCRSCNACLGWYENHRNLVKEYCDE